MTTKTEGNYAAEFLLSEAMGNRSRDTVTIVSGQNLVAGAVLGKITKAGTATAAAYAGNTGDGAMGAITVGAGAKAGDYKLTITEPGTNVGNFIVEDPDGIIVGQGDVAAAFSAGGLSFTLADGATDFVAGDGFTITVAAGSGKYAAYDNTATNGTEVAAGVLYAATDASTADAPGVAILRDAEVSADLLTWHANNDAAAITAGKADLAVAGVLVRA